MVQIFANNIFVFTILKKYKCHIEVSFLIKKRYQMDKINEKNEKIQIILQKSYIFPYHISFISSFTKKNHKLIFYLELSHHQTHL